MRSGLQRAGIDESIFERSDRCFGSAFISLKCNYLVDYMLLLYIEKEESCFRRTLDVPAISTI